MGRTKISTQSRAQNLQPSPNQPIQKLLDCFKQGDLIYGLFSEREPYCTALLARGFVNITVADHNKMDGRFVLTQAKTKPDQQIRARLFPDQQIHYDHLIKHAGYISKPGGKDPDESDNPSTARENSKLRRACKLTAVHAGRWRKNRIHFVLDGINHKRVTTKRRQDGSADPSFTSSELRALYRCKERTPSGAVIFYRSGLSVPAPWLDPNTQALYTAYDQQRQQKKRRASRWARSFSDIQ